MLIAASVTPVAAMICKTLVFCNNGKQESNIDKTEKKYIASENLVLAAATGEAMVRILLLNSMNFFGQKNCDQTSGAYF